MQIGLYSPNIRQRKKLLLQEKVRTSGRQEGQRQARGENKGKGGQEDFVSGLTLTGGAGGREKCLSRAGSLPHLIALGSNM